MNHDPKYNDFEYEKIKKRLMKDYNIISDITA